jgi:hypothetical protein
VAVSDLVTMRLPALEGIHLADNHDVAPYVNRRVPLQLDGITVREAKIVAARVTDGQLEVDLTGVPGIWHRLYEQGKVTLNLGGPT